MLLLVRDKNKGGIKISAAVCIARSGSCFLPAISVHTNGLGTLLTVVASKDKMYGNSVPVS